VLNLEFSSDGPLRGRRSSLIAPLPHAHAALIRLRRRSRGVSSHSSMASSYASSRSARAALRDSSAPACLRRC